MKWIRKQIFWLAGTVVGGFLIWQIATAVTLRSAQPESAGILFGRNVPVQEFLRAQQAAAHQALLRYGEQYRKHVSEEDLNQNAWERLIFLAEAKRKGIRISDGEVIEEIQRSPLFQDRQGRFDQAGYQGIMQYGLGTTPRTFEEETREELMIRKLFDQVIGNPSVSEQEILDEFRKKEESIQADFLLLSVEPIAREVTEVCRQRPGQLEQVAKQLEIKLIRSDFFKRSTPLSDLGTSGVTLSSLFEAQPGEVGGPFKVSKGWLVAKVTAKKPADEKQLDSQKEAIRKEAQGRKKLQGYLAWYEELLKRANPKHETLKQQKPRAKPPR